MPSKKRKYNARFPAGRIKKIMQTDEEVGKVAQAVPIIISRTLELFVESLLSKALQVTASRNAKTLSPSHVKQCILAESRFDFLRDLVKNIPDVSAAEEKEMQMSAESSPNSSRFSDTSVPPRRIVREDSNSSSSCEVRVVTRETLVRALSAEVEQKPRIETITTISTTLPTPVTSEAAIDLTKKRGDRPHRTANFYQETLVEPVQHRSVIRVNPTYTSPQPSTSTYASLTPVEPLNRVEIPKDVKPQFYVDLRQNNNISMTPPRTPVTPILNIDFSKNICKPEIKVLDTVASNAGVSTLAKEKVREKLQRQNSKSKHDHNKESKPPPAPPLDIDRINSGNLQIDEDYDT